MKHILLIIFLFSGLTEASPTLDTSRFDTSRFDTSRFDTSRLNTCLKNLYNKVVQNESLVGEKVTCNLLLKFASKKWILFHDGYVGLDQSSKYSFLKFTKGMKLPEDIASFKKVKVIFKIISTSESVVTRADTWPALEVQLLHISPAN